MFRGYAELAVNDARLRRPEFLIVDPLPGCRRHHDAWLAIVRRAQWRTGAAGLSAAHACRRRADRLHHTLYVATREQEGREASPTAAIIDSQSAKAAQKGAPRSTRKALMRARKSRAASGMSLSTRSAFS